MPCMVMPDTGTFASSLVAYADCQARTIGEQGYLALAAPGSSISQLIVILITILVALFGYRLLLGGVPTLREGVMTLVKVGLTVALATGWPAYQALVYDVVIQAPGELGTTIGGAAGLPGADGDLSAHLDAVDQQFQLLSIYNVSRPVAAPPLGTAPPPLFAGFDVFALGSARVLFLIGAVGSYVATRLIAGLVLALGPLFLAFLLFDTTRGLVEGWIKVLSGAMLGTLATSIILGTELALLEPWLANLIAVRGGDAAITGAAAQLLAATVIFAVTLLAAIAASAKLSWSLRLPITSAGLGSGPTRSRASETTTSILGDRGEGILQSVPRSRAFAIADAVTMLDHRESAALAVINNGSIGPESAVSVSGMTSGARNEMTGRTASNPLSRRRTGTRVSASAKRRDMTS